MRKIRKFRYSQNITRYLLFIYLEDKESPLFVGETYTIRQLLELLSKWERHPKFKGAFLEIENE